MSEPPSFLTQFQNFRFISVCLPFFGFHFLHPALSAPLPSLPLCLRQKVYVHLHISFFMWSK